MTEKQTHYLLLFSLLVLTSFSCSNNSNNSSNKEIITALNDTLSNSSSAPIVAKYDLVISDIPFPFEILDNLYTQHIPFNQNVMNQLSNISKYSQYNSKALNLGIYGADLAYTVTYEQFQQIGAYIKNTKKLAEELNIPFAFNQDMMDKYNQYKNNKDSLTKMVCNSYTEVDRALKSDERVGLAALVVTGSWIEGLYISTKSFVDVQKTDENKSLYKVILDQKQSLIIIIKLLDEYKDDAFFASIINDLNIITSEYNTITTKKSLEEKQLILINQKVAKLRNRIIEGL